MPPPFRSFLAPLVLVLFLLAWTRPVPAAEPAWLLSYEAIPSAQVELPGVEQASYEQRAELTREAARVLVPEILTVMGVHPGKAETEVTPGGYLLRTNASLQTKAPLDGAQARRLAAALGYVFRQYSVLASDFGRGDGGTGYVAISFPSGTLDAARAQRFFEAAAEREEGLDGGYTALDDTMYFLNVRDSSGDPYSRLTDRTFAGLLGEVAAEFGEGASFTGSGQAAVLFVGNDWIDDRDGEGYVAQLGGPGAPELDRLNLLRDRHTRMVLEAADRYGWR
jgi:hypothetical protein